MLLSDVCLLHTSGLSREQRGLGRPNWHRGSPRHTWLGHHFQGQKVKGQGHQAALLTAVLARQAAPAVGVGTCWPWETAATLPSARRCKALRRPRGRRGAEAYRGGRPPTACSNRVTIHRRQYSDTTRDQDIGYQAHTSTDGSFIVTYA